MKKVINIFQTIILVLLNLTIPFIAIIVGLFSRKGIQFIAMRIWSPIHLWVVGGKVTVIGKEKLNKDDAAIYVANHSSHFDIPVIYANIPFFLHFIAKKELKNVPFFGWANTIIGTIWIDRKNKTKAIETIKKAGVMIRSGRNVISFPEGSRSKTGEIEMFKKGSFALAIDTNIDIVPICIIGTRPLNPPGTFSFSRSKVTMIIGDKIKINKQNGKTAIELANETKAIVEKMKDDFLNS